jgi:predicted nucleic acid-binding protein
LVACEVVWAKVAAFFPGIREAEEAMGLLGVRFVPMDRMDALEAASRWSSFGTKSRSKPGRIAADFLIGAHALRHADVLLTRDRGFYMAAFQGLKVEDPSRDRGPEG